MAKKKLLYYEFNEFRLDILSGQLLKNGNPINLTQKCLETLQYLIRNRGRLLKKKELLDVIWSEAFVEESTLSQHIYLLRKALSENSQAKLLIETVPKKGYRFLGEVKEVFEIELENGNIDETDFSDSHKTADSKLTQISDQRFEPLNYIKKIAKQRNHIYIMTGFFLICLSYFFFSFNSETKVKPTILTVFPFQQINQEKNEALSLGMADVLISQLGKLENVEITPRNSIIRFAENNDFDLYETADKLHSDAVLSGTIQRDNETVRVTYQLYCVKNRHLLLAEKIDGEYSNLFAIQDKITQNIFQTLTNQLKKQQKSPNAPKN